MLTREIQMLGNAALMELPKIAFLSSRQVAPAAVMRCYDWATGMRGGAAGVRALPCVIGGFQSALERDVLKLLLPAGGPPIVMVLARGMWRVVPRDFRAAIDEGRMLIVSPFSQKIKRVSHETAEKRNRWILENCDDVFWGSIDPDGTLARLAVECGKGHA